MSHIASALLLLALLLAVAPGFSYTEAGASPARLAQFRVATTTAHPDSGTSGAAIAGQRKRTNSKQAAKKRYKPAPEIIVIGLDGVNIRLGEKRGKVVVVDFWASWCPPCRTMIPIFNSLHDKYRDSGLEIIGVSMDEGTTADLKELADEFGLRYAAADGDRETEEAFGVTVLPTTLLIDRKGRIRARHSGVISQPQLEREINRLLAE